MATVTTKLTAVDETGSAINSAKGHLDALGGSTQQTGSKFSVMAGLAGAAGTATLGFLQSAAQAAADGVLSEQSLATAVNNSGVSWDKNKDSLLAAVDAAQMKYDFDD